MNESVGRTMLIGHSPVAGAAEAEATRMDGVQDLLGAEVFTRQSSASPRNALDGIEVTVRVNTQRTSAAACPDGTQDIVNAEWEPVYPEITRARRLASSRTARS